MPYTPVTPRPISDAEIAVIRAALDRAPSDRPIGELRVPLEALRVVATCPCGCDSVEFRLDDAGSHPVADGFGTRPFGGLVGLLVWGTETEVTGLEVYDLSFDEKGIRLPVAESVTRSGADAA